MRPPLWALFRSYLKKVFWPDPPEADKSRRWTLISCPRNTGVFLRMKLVSALIWDQNPNLEMASNIWLPLSHPDKDERHAMGPKAITFQEKLAAFSDQ